MLPTNINRQLRGQEDNEETAHVIRLTPASGEPALKALLAGEAIPEIPLGRSANMFVAVFRAIPFSESIHQGLPAALAFRESTESSQRERIRSLRRERSPTLLNSLVSSLEFIRSLQIRESVDTVIAIETLSDAVGKVIRVCNLIPFSESDHRGIHAACALRDLTDSRRREYMNKFLQNSNPIPLNNLMSSVRFIRDLQPDESTLIHIMGSVDVPLPATNGMSIAEIAEIPLVTIKEESLHIEGQRTCSICMEDFVTEGLTRQLSCSHRYHEPCIKPWLLLHRTCPLCRQSQ